MSSCPICSGVKFTDYLQCKDHTTTGENFQLKKCDQCGFTFTDPKPDEESIGRYYLSEKYISHTGGSKSLFDTMYLYARSLALKRKQRILEIYSPGKSILDVGCGTGEFLNHMKKNGWKINGVEPSTIANEKAEALTGIQIHKSITAISESAHDSITLWHVLEHLHDLNSTLKRASELLKKSGTIFIAVPNLKSHDAEYYKSHWAAYDVPRHLWHFDQSNMKRLLENNGFHLIDTLPMKMDSFYVSLLSESYKNPNQLKIFNFVRATIRGFVSNIKAMKTTNYSSLIYIAQR